jgi:hypothetical protein
MNGRALRTISAAVLAAWTAAPAADVDGKASIGSGGNRFEIKALPWSEDR